MTTTTADVPLTLTCRGHALDTTPDAFGWLRDSSDARDDPAELRARLDRDGYLYLPGFFPREEVAPVRSRVCQVLAGEGLLAAGHPIDDAVAAPGARTGFRPDIANGPVKAELATLVYGSRVMSFYEELLGGPTRHYDFTWMRAVGPGPGTWPHCDVVFMGRGTPHVYTAWVPLGDIPLDVGGLAVLEGSHRDRDLREGYCTLDVDTSCSTQPERNQLAAAGYPDGYKMAGALTVDLPLIRRSLGYRLLTAAYAMGDLLTFSIFTVHGSLDNHSRYVRMSSDSRYQLASEPVDPRWVGQDPPGHGGSSVREAIC